MNMLYALLSVQATQNSEKAFCRLSKYIDLTSIRYWLYLFSDHLNGLDGEYLCSVRISDRTPSWINKVSLILILDTISRRRFRTQPFSSLCHSKPVTLGTRIDDWTDWYKFFSPHGETTCWCRSCCFGSGAWVPGFLFGVCQQFLDDEAIDDWPASSSDMNLVQHL